MRLGKKFDDVVIERLEKKVKTIKLYNNIYAFLIIIVSIMFLISFNGFRSTNLPLIPSYRNDINLSATNYDLDESEFEDVNDVLKTVDEKYLKFTKSVTVTNDIYNYCELEGGISCNSCRKNGCTGFNARGNIVIEYDEFIFPYTLCHELLHNFLCVDGWDKPCHQIIYDLEYKGVCYINGR